MYISLAHIHDFAKGESILVYPVTSMKFPAMEFRTLMWDMIRTALPLNITKTVIVQAHEQEKKELLDFLRLQVATVLEFNAKFAPLQIHADSFTHTAALVTAQAGVPREFLPHYLGGDLNQDSRIADWVRMRACIESMWTTQSVTHAHYILETFGKPTSRGGSKPALLMERKPGDKSEEQFLRDRNRLYAHRFAQKQQLAEVSLSDQKCYLEQHQQRLVEEKQRLEQALQMAHAAVSTFLQEQERQQQPEQHAQQYQPEQRLPAQEPCPTWYFPS